MNNVVLEFEKPVVELEIKINELKNFGEENQIDVAEEVAVLTKKLEKTKKEVYQNLTSWQKVQLARHPNRPYTMDYIERIFSDFISLHGDRRFAEDPAIVGGFAKIDGQPVMVFGTQKGREVKENVFRNFGCPHPEGYRKALRLMELAEKSGVPIVTFIDTSGAYPGLASEERHVAEAIAVNLREMFKFTVPIICVVIGEGGSGGALGIGVGNKVLILENAYYSVITPEGCAAILWKDRAFSAKAAENLKITSKHLKEFGIIDEIIKEPLGGAHADFDEAAANIKQALLSNLKELKGMSQKKIKEQRYERFRKIGKFVEA